MTIEYEDETTKTFERSEIALIRLALDFLKIQEEKKK